MNLNSQRKPEGIPFPSQMHLAQGNGRTQTPKDHVAPAIERLEAGGTWDPVGSLEKTLTLLTCRGVPWTELPS